MKFIKIIFLIMSILKNQFLFSINFDNNINILNEIKEDYNIFNDKNMTEEECIEKQKIKQIFSHSYNNKYYTTKVYNTYWIYFNKYLPNSFTYHFNLKKECLIKEAKKYNIKYIILQENYKSKKEIADEILNHNNFRILPFIIKKMNDFGIDHNSIRYIVNLI